MSKTSQLSWEIKQGSVKANSLPGKHQTTSAAWACPACWRGGRTGSWRWGGRRSRSRSRSTLKAAQTTSLPPPAYAGSRHRLPRHRMAMKVQFRFTKQICHLTASVCSSPTLNICSAPVVLWVERRGEHLVVWVQRTGGRWWGCSCQGGWAPAAFHNRSGWKQKQLYNWQLPASTKVINKEWQVWRKRI